MKRVLLIEHDVSTRRALEFNLALRGYITTIASDTRQFRDLAQRSSFAVLIAGRSAEPDGSPSDLCRVIREMPELADTALVVLETAANADAIEAALRAGANGVLTRPVDPIQLDSVLATLEQAAEPQTDTPPAGPQPADADLSVPAVLERYRVLVERSMGLTFIVEPDGEIVWANAATGRILDHDPETLTGSNVFMLCHSDDASTLAGLLDTVMTSRDAPAPTVDVRFLRRDNTAVDLELGMENLQQHPAIDGLVLVGHDVSARVERERALRGQVLRDALTGLPNRLLFIDQAVRTLARAERRNEPVVLVFVDLDDLQEVNQRHGRPAVDELLQAVATRLSSTLRANDTTSRFGGDEFAILLDDIASEEDAAIVAERLLAELTRPYEVSGGEGSFSIVVTSSIGVAVSRAEEGATRGADESRLDDLLRRADAALTRAKASGKARWVNADDLGRWTHPPAYSLPD